MCIKYIYVVLNEIIFTTVYLIYYAKMLKLNRLSQQFLLIYDTKESIES